ncbi:MAG: MerR family transcriptional regulator [Actinomycetota bacterium]
MASAQSNVRAISSSGKLHTIGQVLGLLNPDFPDLSPSKLRFLEEQGLIEPQRTPAGYRKFTEQDVQRTRVILELQRDQYLPLRVIRDYLEQLDQGKAPNLPSVQSVSKLQPKNPLKLTKVALMSETGISAGVLQEAQTLMLINKEPFSSADVEIARAIVHLQRFGIAPRHLRGLKASADREIGIIEGVVAPVLGKNEAASASRAAHYAQEIENQFAAIRSELIRAVISRIDS